MAAPTKSSIITNLDARPPVLSNVGVSHGRMRYKSVVHTIPILNSADGDAHRLLRFNSGDRIHVIHLYSDGDGDGDADLGLYLAVDGAVIDADMFADLWAVDTETTEATAAQINYRYQDNDAAIGAFEVSLGKTLWEMTGRGVGAPLADPFEQYDLTLTMSGAALTTADTTVGVEVFYTAGD